MPSLLDDIMVSRPAAEPLAPFVDTDQFDEEQKRYAGLAAEYDRQTAPAAAAPHKPMFRYENRQQTDGDPYGDLTVEAGKLRGQTWRSDEVKELNFFGRVIPYEEFRQVEGGKSLARLVARQRTGRRGFTEALTKGSNWDFVPYAGDVASLGVSIRNMSKVRDTIHKIEEQGVDKLSTQELVFAKMYMEDMERQSNSTWGGKVGSIVRMAPAFAAEFLTSGLIFKGAVKGAKALGLVAREGSERAITKTARALVSAQARSGVEMTQEILEEIAQEAAETAAPRLVREAMEKGIAKGAVGKTAAEGLDALRRKALAEAVKYNTALQAPGGLRALGRFASEYASRGLFDHADDVVRDLPKGFKNQLREALGVAFVEAPVKGGLYAAFDFYGMNPLIGAIAGADEVVTKQEFGFSLSSDPKVRAMAKQLAFGAAWAEYASENSGRAFGAVGGMIGDFAKGTGRAAAKGAMAAAGPVGPSPKAQGSFIARLFTKVLGTEESYLAGLRGIKGKAVELAAKEGSEVTQEFLAKAAKEKGKAFWGYYFADKMSKLGLTPHGVARKMEQMGYDGLVEELLEERYSGFAQGLFGLDEAPSRPFMARIAEAWDQAVPDTASDFFAEVVAFAVPMGIRSASAMAYRGLGSSNVEQASSFGRSLSDMTGALHGKVATVKDGKIVATQEVVKTTAGTGSVTETLAKQTTAEGYLENLPQLDDMVDTFTELAANTLEQAQDSKPGLLRVAARTVVGAIEALASGNPLMMFRNPVNAIINEDLGNKGRVMLYGAHQFIRYAYAQQSDIIASQRKRGEVGDPAADHAAIMKAIGPNVRAAMEGIVKKYLRTSGVFVMDSKDISNWVEGRQDGDGKIAGMPAADFQKKFETEIAAAAAGRMRAEIHGESVTWAMEAEAPAAEAGAAELQRDIEDFFAKEYGVSPVRDGDAYDPTVAPVYSGRSVSWDVINLAASDRKDTDAEAARMELIKATRGGFNFQAGPEAVKRSFEAMRDYARVLREAVVAFAPQAYINQAGARFDVSLRDGTAVLRDAEGKKVGGFEAESWQAVGEKLTADGYTKDPNSGIDVRYVPGTDLFYTVGAALIANPSLSHYLDNYMVGNDRKIMPNPYSAEVRESSGKTFAELRAGAERALALAKQWEDAGLRADGFTSAADATRAESAWKEALNDGADGQPLGWEYAARQALIFAGIEARPKPTDGNVRGWMMSAAAYNQGRTLYLPYRYLGNAAALIEDAAEIRLKNLSREVDRERILAATLAKAARESVRKTMAGKPEAEIRAAEDAAADKAVSEGTRNVSSLFAVYDPGLGRAVYRPAVRAMVEAAQTALLELSRTRGDGVSEITRKEARALAAHVFNPNSYNIEAVSHLLSGVTFYQADEHRHGGGTAGSAYYATLGHVAQALRDNRQVFLPWNSLVDRMIGGKPDGNMEALRNAYKTLTPGGYTDAAMKTGVPASAASDDPAAEIGWVTGKRIPADAYNRNLGPEADQKARVDAAWNAAVGGGNTRGLLPEDYPEFARQALRGVSLNVAYNEALSGATPGSAGEVAEAAADAEDREQIPEPPGPPASASLADSVTEHPLFYSVLATSFAKHAKLRFGRTFPEPPDPKRQREAYKRWAFDYWVAANLGLGEGQYAKFSEQYDVERPAGDAELSDTDGLGDLSGQTQDEPDERGPLADDFDPLDDNAAAEAVYRLARALQGVLDVHLPAAQGETIVAVNLWRAAAEARGDTGPESLRALLTGEDGPNSVHPVFASKESFRAWVQKRLASDVGKTEFTLYAIMEALGYEGSVRVLTALRGAVPVQGFTPRMNPEATRPPDGGIAVRGDTNERGAGLHTRASVAVESEAARNIQALRNELGDKAPAYFKKIAEEIEAESKKNTFGNLGWDPNASRKALLAEAGRRAGVAADFADRLFGDGNTVSAALRSRHVLARFVDDHVNGIKNGRKSSSVLEYALATQMNKGIGNFARGIMRAAEVAANGADPVTAASMLHEDGWAQDAKVKRNPGERSSLSEALDYYGESIPPGAVRAAGEGGKRVKLVDPANSPAHQKFLQDPLFGKMSALTDADADEADVKRYAGRGLWADGVTPIFGRAVGIVDSAGRDRAEPTVSQLVMAAVGDVARVLTGDKQQRAVPIYDPKGDKSANSGVLVPAKYFLTPEMSGLSAVERYNKAYAAVMGSMLANTVDGKRMPVIFTGAAAPAPLATRAQVTVVAGEHMKGAAIHGSATGLERIAFAMLDAVRQRMKKIHVHGTSPDGGYMFSKANFMDAEGTSEDPAVHPAERALAKLAMAALKKGYAQAVVTDMDPFKLDPRKKIVTRLLNGEIEADTVVKYGGEDTTPAKMGLRLSEVETGADAAGNPVKVRAVSFDADLRVTRAATLHDSAQARQDSESVVQLRPGTAEDHRMTDGMIRAAVGLNDIFNRLFGEKPAQYEAERDPAIRELWATGVIPYGPHINARAEAALAAQVAANQNGPGFTSHATAGGGAIEGLGVPGTAVLDAETVNGVYYPALVQANIRLHGWERPALAFNEADSRVARNLSDVDKREAVETAWARLEALRGMPDAYKKALADFQKMFVYQDGSPLPAGRAMTFADLMFRGAFDKGAWRRTPQGKTLLGGTGFIISRVPGVDPARARHYVRWSGPSTSVQAGATVRAPTFEGKAGGFEAGPFDSPDDALVGVSAGTHLFTGHDNDGDAIFESFPRFSRDGSLDASGVDFEAAAKELQAAKGKGEAAKILTKHLARLSNGMLEARRDLLTRNAYGEPRATTTEFIPAAMLEKLSGGVGKFGFTDAAADAALTDATREEAALRGIIVALGASLDRARALGLDLFRIPASPFVSAEGRALGPEIAGFSGPAMDDVRHAFVMSVIDDMANATYDNTKQIARLVRAGFGAPFMGLFAAALYGSGATTREQVYALAESFSAWAKSPAGQAVRRQYTSRDDSTVIAPFKGERVGTRWVSAERAAEQFAKSLYGTVTDERGREHVRSALWGNADPQARLLAAAAAQALKGSAETRRKQADGMLVLMGAQMTLRDLKTVLEADKDAVATVDKAQRLGEARERLVKLGVSGWRMDRAQEMMDAARGARAGHVRYSRIERTGRDKDSPAADDSDVLMAAQAHGALSVAPKDLMERVLKYVDAAMGNTKGGLRGLTRTQAFKVIVEQALVEMLGKHRDRWAEARDVSRLNPFLTGVRVSSWKLDKGVWGYPPGPKAITMRSSDTAVADGALRGFLALASETDGTLDIPFDIGDGKGVLTPRDMAALLKVYFAITAPIPLGPGRSAVTVAGFLTPALSDVLYGAWGAAQSVGNSLQGLMLADLAQSARENRREYDAGSPRVGLLDGNVDEVLGYAGTETLSGLKARHAEWRKRFETKAEVVEDIAPASREAKAEDAPKPEPEATPAVQGENIWSGARGLAGSLTNMTELARRKGMISQQYPVTIGGQTFVDAEAAYKSKRSGDTAADLAWMTDVIEAKLRQHPDLATGISAKGGQAWLEASWHDTGRIDRWTGMPGHSLFVKALSAGYARVAAQTEAPVSSPASVAISKAAAESANAAANTEITQGLFADPQAQLAVIRTDPNADRNKEAAEAFGAGLKAAVSTAVPWADDGLRAAAARAAEAIAAVGYVSPKLASGAWLAVGSDARRRGNADAAEQIATIIKNAKLGTTPLWDEYLTAARTIMPAVAAVGARVRAAPAFDAAAATLGYAAAMTPGIRDADAAARAAGRAMKALGLAREAAPAPAPAPAPVPAPMAAAQDATPQPSLATTNPKTRVITMDEAAVRADWDAGFPYLRGTSPLRGSFQKVEVFRRVDLDAFRAALGSPERYIEFIRAHEEGHLNLYIDQGRKYPKDWLSPEAILMERSANKFALDKLGIAVADIRKKTDVGEGSEVTASLAYSRDRDEAVTDAALKEAVARIGAFAYRTLPPEWIRGGRPLPGPGMDAIKSFNDRYKPMAIAATRVFISSGLAAAQRLLRSRVRSAAPEDREAVALAAQALDLEFLREWEEKADAISYKRDPEAYEAFAIRQEELQIEAEEAAREAAEYQEMLWGPQESGMDELGGQALGHTPKREIPENLTQGVFDFGSATMSLAEVEARPYSPNFLPRFASFMQFVEAVMADKYETRPEQQIGRIAERILWEKFRADPAYENVFGDMLEGTFEKVREGDYYAIRDDVHVRDQWGAIDAVRELYTQVQQIAYKGLSFPWGSVQPIEQHAWHLAAVSAVADGSEEKAKEAVGLLFAYLAQRVSARSLSRAVAADNGVASYDEGEVTFSVAEQPLDALVESAFRTAADSVAKSRDLTDLPADDKTKKPGPRRKTHASALDEPVNAMLARDRVGAFNAVAKRLRDVAAQVKAAAPADDASPMVRNAAVGVLEDLATYLENARNYTDPRAYDELMKIGDRALGERSSAAAYLRGQPGGDIYEAAHAVGMSFVAKNQQDLNKRTPADSRPVEEADAAQNDGMPPLNGNEVVKRSIANAGEAAEDRAPHAEVLKDFAPTPASAAAVGAVAAGDPGALGAASAKVLANLDAADALPLLSPEATEALRTLRAALTGDATARAANGLDAGRSLVRAAEVVKTAREALRAELGRDTVSEYGPAADSARKALALAEEASSIALSALAATADADLAHAASGRGAGSPPAAVTDMKRADAAAELGRAALMRMMRISSRDSALGTEDFGETFRFNFIDPRVWFANVVLPDLWGADARKILLDKTALLELPRTINVANDISSIFAVSATGEILGRSTVAASGIGYEEGKVVKGSPGDKTVVRTDRRTLPTSMLRSTANHEKILSDTELQASKWALLVANSIAADSLGGRTSLNAGLDLADVWRYDLLAPAGKDYPGMRVLDVMFNRDARKAILAKSPGQRPFATDVLMDRVFESLPQGSPLYDQFIGALKVSIEKAFNKHETVRERAQAVYFDLFDQGRTVRQVRVGKGGTREHYNVRVAVPHAESLAYWEGSDAYAKLMRNKRTAAELDLRNVAAKVAEEQGRIDRHAASMGWMVDGDGRLFGNSPLAPFFKGAGAFRYGMSRLLAFAPPGYREAVIKQMESLDRIPTHETVRDPETDLEVEVPITLDSAARQQRFARLFSYLRDLRPDVFKDNLAQASAVEIADAVTSNVEFQRRLEIPQNPTVWDAALAVHRAASARLLTSAWNNGEKADARMADVPIEAFNNMIGAMIAERAPAFRRGATATEIYELTGAQPLNLGADEALTRHASEVATMSRWRLALNQMLLATDHEGLPLYYARPGAHADDAVSDDMWGYVARRWVQIHGRPGDTTIFYDESKPGRDNAIALYDAITPNKEALSSTREARGGVERYTLKTVALPLGMETFSGLKAQADPPGDDTKAAMNAHAGGEAAAMAEQIMAVPGFTGVGEGWKYVNRFWSWSKSLSVMNSLFFPIATAFESPAAATGFAPTVLGFSGSGSRFARWAASGDGVVSKAFRAAGLDADAPGMAEIMKFIGSDDPGLIELRIHAEAAGIMSNDRAKNMWDHDRTMIAKDINATVAKAEAAFGKPAARNLRIMLEGMMQNSSELAFEYIINATKLAVFAQMNNRLRNQAIRAGRWWDPIRDMKKWSHYINAEVGGIDPAMYPWMTPKMQQWLKAGVFSWAWTLGAWSAGGGDAVTAKLFGLPAGKQIRGFMLTRWMRMYFGIMVGVPAVMQIVCTALGKAGGGDDDEDKESAKNDKWGVWQNEKSKRWRAWDITPMLRAMKNAPAMAVLPAVGAIAGIGGGWKGALVGAAGASAATWLTGLAGKTMGEAKEALPETVMGLPVGALIPANTGQEGSRPTTRRRRYYMNLGKQGWEVARWFENPTGSFLSKMSLPVQKMLEGLLGVNPSSGFDTPFKDMSFWDRWTSLDGEKSALLNVGKAWLPFSYQGVIRNPEAGALSAAGVISKGTSKTAAVKEMATMFSQWADADGYAAMMKANPGSWTDLRSMAVEWLNAVRLNGYDPETELKNAVSLARRDLYAKVHAALPQYPTGKGDRRALEEAARGLYRLNVVHKNLLQSIKARDKNQHIKRTGDFLDKSNNLLREAFENPHGIRTDERLGQSADLGGDVSGFLATDEVPATILGYRVVGPEDLSEGDLKFFTDHPDVAAFFEKGVK